MENQKKQTYIICLKCTKTACKRRNTVKNRQKIRFKIGEKIY